MKVKVVKKKAADVSADVILLPVVEGDEEGGFGKRIGAALRKRAEERSKRLRFKAKPGSTMLVQGDSADLFLVGIGDGKTDGVWRRAGGSAFKAAVASEPKTAVLCLGRGEAIDSRVEAFCEGFHLASYRFDRYRKTENDNKRKLATLIIAAPAVDSVRTASAAMAKVGAVCDAVCEARDLVNEMPSAKSPNVIVKAARKIAREGGLGCEVWRGQRLAKEKMNGILAVSAGSDEPGAFIRLTYSPKRKAKKRIAVVGKGVTFDSGGLSLKPAKSMETMKLDMAGAAAVLGLMRALPIYAPAVEVRGYIASAENMPGSGAQKPGDVIRFRNGKTAEVLNTDAEGRLVLADALCVASEWKPDYIIDLATLTGACMVALGSEIAGVLGNDQDLVDSLLERGRETGEKLWQLPLAEEYRDSIRSSVADIKNIGGGYGGSITAALFLSCFVDDCKWAHLDIAGPAFIEKPSAIAPRGGTGFGVRTLLSFVRSLA